MILGPFRETRRPSSCAAWTVLAVEELQPDGASTRWDVHLVHESGARVPAGPNVHADPEPEIERLLRAVDASPPGGAS